MNTRITVTNEKEQAITLYLEPWAEEYVIEPNGSLGLIGSGPPGQFEVAACKEGLTVYGWSGSTVRVLRDGVDVSEGSGEIPSP